VRIDQIGELDKRLAAFYPDEKQRDAWWQSPQKLLDGRAPIGCAYEEICRLIALLEGGTAI
jgi:hypothetical protein